MPNGKTVRHYRGFVGRGRFAAQLTTHYEQYKITVGNYLKEINYKHRVLKSNIRAGKAILETGKHGAETQDCQEHF